jgi:transposase InsO family protein
VYGRGRHSCRSLNIAGSINAKHAAQRRGLTFHTDQGGEYTGEVFTAACRSAGVTQSMGRAGSALDKGLAA